MTKRDPSRLLLICLLWTLQPLAAQGQACEELGTTAGVTEMLVFNGAGLDVTTFAVTGVAPLPDDVDCVTTVSLTVLLIGDIGGVGFEQTNIRGEDGNVLGLSANAANDCNAAGGTVTFDIPVATYNLWAADGTIDLSIDADPDIDNICPTQTIQASVTECLACETPRAPGVGGPGLAVLAVLLSAGIAFLASRHLRANGAA